MVIVGVAIGAIIAMIAILIALLALGVPIATPTGIGSVGLFCDAFEPVDHTEHHAH